MAPRLLLIDCYDSYTFNLFQICADVWGGERAAAAAITKQRASPAAGGRCSCSADAFCWATPAHLPATPLYSSTPQRSPWWSTMTASTSPASAACWQPAPSTPSCCRQGRGRRSCPQTSVSRATAYCRCSFTALCAWRKLQPVATPCKVAGIVRQWEGICTAWCQGNAADRQRPPFHANRCLHGRRA